MLIIKAERIELLTIYLGLNGLLSDFLPLLRHPHAVQINRPVFEKLYVAKHV